MYLYVFRQDYPSLPAHLRSHRRVIRWLPDITTSKTAYAMSGFRLALSGGIDYKFTCFNRSSNFIMIADIKRILLTFNDVHGEIGYEFQSSTKTR